MVKRMEFQQTYWVDPVGCRSDILTWVFGASFKHIVYAFTTLTPRVLPGHLRMMTQGQILHDDTSDCLYCTELDDTILI